MSEIMVDMPHGCLAIRRQGSKCGKLRLRVWKSGQSRQCGGSLVVCDLGGAAIRDTV